MRIKPVVVVSEGVPDEVSGDAGQHGEDDEKDAAAEAEWLERGAEAAFDVDGQKRDDRQADKTVEEPEDSQAKRQAEAECAGEGVSPSAAGSKPKEIFEIRGHGADDDGGEDEPGSAHRQGRGNMG